MKRPGKRSLPQRLKPLLMPILAAALLAGCGGDDSESGPASCSATDQKAWLGSYMNDWYFWYAISPRPSPAGFADAETYFDALLYTGTSTTFPADRWSGRQSTESFNRFYGDGATLGYGVTVAGLELERDGTLPLYVRYIEPLSPAAAQGVARGDRVMSINGRDAGALIAADDFSALTPAQAGDSLTLVLRRAGVDRSVTLNAAVFNLTPVQGARVFTSPGGRRIGYVLVKDMISQVLNPLDTAFASFRSQGVQDLVLDLRYNGGGLVSVAAQVSSYVAGQRGSGRRFASLLYNDKRQSNNQSISFSQPTQALGVPRVFVLMGRRTCSASEQVINGLRGAGVEVVAVGETSCGKPVGFNPTSNCGTTWSAVTFESVNHANEGRYFDGFAPTCAVPEVFTTPTGQTGDPLLDAAVRAADTGLCPQAGNAAAERARALAARPARERAQRWLSEGDSRPAMLAP
jgi:carboxyl-terminal processing protease